MNSFLRTCAGAASALLMALGPVALLLAPIAGMAQSSPGFVNGQPPPTAAQWNSYFAAKTDYLPGSVNAVPYWNGAQRLVSAPVTGDCTAIASRFTCPTLSGVRPGNLFPLNAGTGLSIGGGNLNVTNAVPSNLTITNPASPATLTVAGGKTITLSNTITFTAVDGSTLGIGAGGTLGPLAYAPGSLAANSVIVTDGSSVPSASTTLPSAVQSNITAVGTVASGTWAGTAVGPTHGGTGLTGGTSGGVNYWSSSTTMASSGALTANAPVIGGGAGAAPSSGTRHGNTTDFATVTGATTNAHLATWDASGNLQDGGVSPGSPAITLISTQTASSSATLQWTGLGSSYNSYLLDCNGIQPSNQGAIFSLQVGTGGTPTWQTSSYHEDLVQITAATVSGQTDSLTSAYSITGNAGMDTSGNSAAGMVTKVWIENIASSSLYKNMTSHTTMTASTGNGYTVTGGGRWSGTTVVTAIRVQVSAGTIAVGQCSLYAMVP